MRVWPVPTLALLSVLAYTSSYAADDAPKPDAPKPDTTKPAEKEKGGKEKGKHAPGGEIALTYKLALQHAAEINLTDEQKEKLLKLKAVVDEQNEKLKSDPELTSLHAQMKEGRDHHGKHGNHAKMQEWATDLKLTDAQKDQIKAAFQAKHKDHEGDIHAEMKDHHAKGGQVMDAFKSEHFVMDEVSPKVDTKQAAAKMSGRMLGMIEVVLPILTPEQRKIAADKIRAHAAAGDDHGMF